MRPRSFSIVLGFVLGVVAATAIPGLLASPPAARSGAPSRGADEPANMSPLTTVYAADLLRVIDGDTFDARIHVWPGLAVTTRVRLRGIDAPELHAHCPQERSKAEAARTALAAILADGQIRVLHIGPDKYNGRIVADAATARTTDVSATMLRSGLARAYDGGRRAGWCDL
jgi:endonuclease YncB( thermonuclease family)